MIAIYLFLSITTTLFGNLSPFQGSFVMLFHFRGLTPPFKICRPFGADYKSISPIICHERATSSIVKSIFFIKFNSVMFQKRHIFILE